MGLHNGRGACFPSNKMGEGHEVGRVHQNMGREASIKKEDQNWNGSTKWEGGNIL